MTFLIGFLAAALYLALGFCACVLVDGSRRHGQAVQKLSGFGELVSLLLWPVALPLLMYANPARKRR